jgi:hypothetical protein
MLADPPGDDPDRYVVRRDGLEWCVWDTMQNARVFGADGLTERYARELASRLSAAYRRATSRHNAG